MAEPLFEATEQCLLVTRFDIDDPVETEPRLLQRWREEILAHETPQHFARGARRNAGSKQSGGSAIDRAISASRYFMNRGLCQTATRQMLVDRRNAERQRSGTPLMARFDLLDAGAKGLNGCWRRHVRS